VCQRTVRAARQVPPKPAGLTARNVGCPGLDEDIQGEANEEGERHQSRHRFRINWAVPVLP